jgi:hypothetical protein
VSETSPATGPADDTATPSSPRQGDVSVELEPSRQRQLSWAIFGTAFGIVLVWKLGTVAVWVGFVLIALGLFRAYQLARSFMFPPGTIEVSSERVSLPLGVHKGKPLVVKPADVTAVYFLRRSVPWNHASPVLVVELGPRALLYPRDWFATEADQRRVVHALVGQLPDA